ncbi:MAG: signal peptidase II [Coriobacteriia bacterium]|nr:signal peptidase II [Coriobacteriia bacterium]
MLDQPRKMFQAVVVFWLLLDFMTKQVVVQFMDLRESIPLWEGVFHLTSVRNSGAAFSLMEGQFWVFYLAMALLALIVAWYWVSERPRHWMPVLGTALVMAGALGNTADRLATGAVVDMFDFRLINFAIFNVADVGITVGSILFVVWLVFLSEEVKWGEIFGRRKAAPNEIVPAMAGATDISVVATEKADAAEAAAIKEALPRLSLWERLELKLQKWEADIEHEEGHG